MTNLLINEYCGFLKFLNRARDKIINWYGNCCNFDASRIVLMAALEWDGMADIERKYFIKSYLVNSSCTGTQVPSDLSPYIAFKLERRHMLSKVAGLARSEALKEANLVQEWKSLTPDERDTYSDLKLSDLIIDHVLDQRDLLHQRYSPLELLRLEYIARSRPHPSTSPFAWFVKLEKKSLRPQTTAKIEWKEQLKDGAGYYKHISKFDQQRYKIERDAWIAKLATLDLDNIESFRLEKFKPDVMGPNVEILASILATSSDIKPPIERVKPPRLPFSLFIEYHQAQIKDTRTSKFEFGEHLRSSSEAWKKLTAEEKQQFIEQSRELREEFIKNNPGVNPWIRRREDLPLSVEEAIRSHKRSIKGPSRPSHLLKTVPKVHQIYAEENNISLVKAKRKWDELSDEEKKPYLIKQEQIAQEIEKHNEELTEKITRVRKLIKESKNLDTQKKELLLLRTSNRPIKLYD